MSTVGIGILVGLATLSAVRAGRRRLERRRARRSLHAQPLLTAESREGTVVRVTGTVRVLDSRLVGPLSGSECVAYRARIYVGDGPTKKWLRMRTAEDQKLVPFAIELDGQQVIIEGSHAWLDLPAAKALTEDGKTQLMLTLGIGYPLRTRSRFEELLVTEGTRISVAGLLMLDPPAAPSGEERGFREAPQPRPRLVGDSKHPLIIGEPVD